MDKLEESERKKYSGLTKNFLNKILITLANESDINTYDGIMGLVNDHFHDFAIEYLEEQDKISIFEKKYRVFIDKLNNINMTRECNKYFNYIVDNKIHLKYDWELIYFDLSKNVSIINKSLFIKMLNKYIIH